MDTMSMGFKETIQGSVLLVSMPGMGELLVILLIILVLFGGSKIPEIARNIGKGIREFKKGLGSEDSSDDDTGSSPAGKK